MFEIGIRFVWHSLFAQEEEVVEGALKHARLAGFVAVHEGELGAFGEGGEGVSHAVEGVVGPGAVGGGVHHGGLDGPGAALAPLGGGQFLDEGLLELVEGAEAGFERSLELMEFTRGFILKDHGMGQQAMTKGVLAGTLLSLGRDGSPGAGSVGPRRFDSTLRRHIDNFPIARHCVVLGNCRDSQGPQAHLLRRQMSQGKLLLPLSAQKELEHTKGMRHLSSLEQGNAAPVSGLRCGVSLHTLIAPKGQNARRAN